MNMRKVKKMIVRVINIWKMKEDMKFPGGRNIHSA